jgi:hypothetical protein
MTFLLPHGYEGTRTPHAPKPTSPEEFCIAPQPWAIDCASVYDYRCNRACHPNGWDDIAQWFRTNLTYETDEMFQPYIQGHL